MVNPLALNYYNMGSPATTNPFSNPLNSPIIHQSFANASVFPGYNPSPYTPQMSYNNPISYGSFGNPMAYNAVSDMFGMSSIFGPGNYIPISGSGSVLSSGLSMANPMQTPLGYNAVSDMFGFNSNLGTSNFNSFTNFATSYENDSSLQRLMQLGDLMFNGGQSTTTPLAKTPTNNSTTTTLSDILLKNTSTNNTGEGDNKLRSLFGGLDSLTTNGPVSATNSGGVSWNFGLQDQEGDSKLRSLFSGLDSLTTNGPLPATNYGGVSWNFSLQDPGGDSKLQSLFSGLDALTTNGPLPSTNYGGVSMDFSLQGDRQILGLFSGLNQF